VTGAVGPTGNAGATGAQGPGGPTGAAGTSGLDGVTGATGPTGVTGATGSTGVAGVTGATGVSGTGGTQGATGATGPTGARGPTGQPGSPGANGATGGRGPTGPTGGGLLSTGGALTGPSGVPDLGGGPILCSGPSNGFGPLVELGFVEGQPLGVHVIQAQVYGKGPPGTFMDCFLFIEACDGGSDTMLDSSIAPAGLSLLYGVVDTETDGCEPQVDLQCECLGGTVTFENLVVSDVQVDREYADTGGIIGGH
jgi:hypothetical protein